MQEEVENRTVNLAISTTKLTGRTIIAGIRKYLFYGNVILPFIDRFPTDLELYRIMTTKLNEVAQEKEA